MMPLLEVTRCVFSCRITLPHVVASSSTAFLKQRSGYKIAFLRAGENDRNQRCDEIFVETGIVNQRHQSINRSDLKRIEYSMKQLGRWAISIGSGLGGAQSVFSDAIAAATIS
jgi:hypothetical protein